MHLITFNFHLDLPTEEQLIAHRAYFDEKVQKGLILVAGPKDPRTGGVIITTTDDTQAAEAIVAGDPYYIDRLADYQITKFKAVKYHAEIAKLIQ